MKKTLLISIACASLIAQETFTLKEQTVTATHLAQDELSYAAPVEIYNREDIENSKSKNIYDFLNQETSIMTIPAFGNQFTQKIDLRGFGISDGYQNIVVVINGRRMNNIDMVPQLLSSIPIDSVSKIEILKGSGSVEYGDGATAGVISITTKDYNGVNFKAYGGSFGTKYGSLGAGYADDLFSISTFGDYYETDGQRDLNAGGKDSARSKNGSFNLKVFPSDIVELRLGYMGSRVKNNYAGYLTLEQYNEDPTQAGRDDNLQFYDTNTYSIGLSADLSNTLTFDVNAYIEDKNSDYTNDYGTGLYLSTAEYDYKSGDMTLKYKNNGLNLAFGSFIFDGSRHTETSSGSNNNVTKDNLAIFVKADYKTKRHNFTTGIRVENVKYSYNDASTSLKQDDTLYAYELGYNYTLTKEQSLFASYAHAFQAPDVDRFFATIYGPAPTYTPTVGFNGFIEPMKSDTYNIGYNYFLKNNKFKATVFYIDLKDEIYLNPFTYANTNLDDSSKLGFELYDKYLILDNLYISANYTYVDAKVNKDAALNIENKTLPGVSKHNITASIGYAPTQESKIILSHAYRSEAYALGDFDNSFFEKQDAYNSTDISAAYQFGEHIEVFAKIQNLFDQSNGIWVADHDLFAFPGPPEPRTVVYPGNFQREFQIGLSGKF